MPESFMLIHIPHLPLKLFPSEERIHVETTGDVDYLG